MNQKPIILIVDDERNTREGLRRALRRNYQIILAENGKEALDLIEGVPVDAVLSDIRMPGMDGLTLMRRLLARPTPPLVILLTAYGSVDQAVEAMKLGAYDFLTKPVNLDRLDLMLKRALKIRDMETENQNLHKKLNEKYGLENIIGQSNAMQEVFDTVRQVADSRATVLITGESGTGKELAARAIHQLSPRSQAPLITVHCAALSGSLLESELFGHEKGAFTGASEQRKGRFELADGGTLFLDEIGEIDSNTQVKILRVLEEKRFERVGGQETIDVDVRLVAATNRNLKAMVEEGEFREDLYYRLNVVVVNLPPLREREQDVPLLINHYLKLLAAENNKSISGVTPDAMEVLTQYRWPGNIRELRNIMERMVVLARGDRLTLRDIPQEIRPEKSGAGSALPSGGSMEEAEKVMIRQALEKNNGNRTHAASQLGISRRTLHRKLNQYGIE